MLHYNKLNYSNGFVMLVVLIFMQLFFLLGVYSLLSNVHMIKLSQRFFQRDQMQLLAWHILSQVEKKVLQNQQRCQSALTAAWTWSERDKKWWKQHACAGNAQGMDYYYLVESLGPAPCQQLLGQTRVADYKRITLFIPLPMMHRASSILQSTLVIPFAGMTPICSEKMRQVLLGRQMGRRIA